MKVGDVVILRNSTGMSAKPGATAVIKESYDYGAFFGINFIYVKWDRNNPLCSHQNDGCYEAPIFHLLMSAPMPTGTIMSAPTPTGTNAEEINAKSPPMATKPDYLSITKAIVGR